MLDQSLIFRTKIWKLRAFLPDSCQGRRQGWAHSPRLPLRPPLMLLSRHCPEKLTHNAPMNKDFRRKPPGFLHELSVQLFLTATVRAAE